MVSQFVPVPTLWALVVTQVQADLSYILVPV